MNNFIKVLIIILLITIIGGIYNGYRDSLDSSDVRDTCFLVRIDTILDTVQITHTKIKEVEREIIRRDTIKEDTVLLYESKHFQDTLNLQHGNAVLDIFTSGIDTRIDSLKIDAQIEERVVEIEKTITIQKNKHFFYGATVGVGYGLVNRRPDVFVGISIGWKF